MKQATRNSIYLSPDGEKFMLFLTGYSREDIQKSESGQVEACLGIMRDQNLVELDVRGEKVLIRPKVRKPKTEAAQFFHRDRVKWEEWREACSKWPEEDILGEVMTDLPPHTSRYSTRGKLPPQIYPVPTQNFYQRGERKITIVTAEADEQVKAARRGNNKILGVSPIQVPPMCMDTEVGWTEEIPEAMVPGKIWITIHCEESYAASKAYANWSQYRTFPADTDEPEMVLKRSGMPLSFLGVKAEFGSMNRKDQEYFA